MLAGMPELMIAGMFGSGVHWAVLDFLSESALLTGERYLAAG